MYSNEYLEYWGELFTACRLSEHGVVFHEFLDAPWRCLGERQLLSAPVSLALGYKCLLPRQARVAMMLWKQWEEEEDKANQPRTPVGIHPSDALRTTCAEAASRRRQQPCRPVREFVRSALSPAVVVVTRLSRKS